MPDIRICHGYLTFGKTAPMILELPFKDKRELKPLMPVTRQRPPRSRPKQSGFHGGGLLDDVLAQAGQLRSPRNIGKIIAGISAQERR